MNSDDEIKLELLQLSYWEHFKHAKDLALSLPIDHPKRKQIEAEVNKLSTEIQKIKNHGNSSIGN